MEAIAVANPISIDGPTNKSNTVEVKIDVKTKKRILVSNTKKPFVFYLKLAQKYIKQHDDIELSALGMSIPTVIAIAEILKTNGVAVQKNVSISTVGTKDDVKGFMIQKPKIEILLRKNKNAKIWKATDGAALEEAAAEKERQISSEELDLTV